MSTNQIINGGFQDNQGNPLVNGTVKFTLSNTCTDGNTTMIAPVLVEFALNSEGNVPNESANALWVNGSMVDPDNNISGQSYYMMEAFDENGQRVYGPNPVQILSSPSPFDLDALAPNNPS